ncbi:MAG TPA: peptidylprolyl isomerase [Candidatus Acidoferrum sp.]|nr:peptidylprolyl isomerase [Candidatus Acidoferrum sp.]
MQKIVLFAAVIFAAPLYAQQPPANPPAKPAKPTLEEPGEAPNTTQPAAAPAPAPAPPPTPSELRKMAAKPISPEGGTVVEEIIARVNNEIITRSDYDKELGSAEEEAKQDCQGRCTPQQLQAEIDDRKKNALRDLIDQSLLEQRGKDMDINVETDVVKQLDQIRTQNNLDSMDALEKAVTAQGMNWEDFKSNIRNKILVQKVVSQEVGSHITIGHDDVLKYYDAHKADYVRPEEVALREIEVSTVGKPESEIPELKKKAETALKRVQDGEDFGEIAKRFSDGATAKQGGYLGMYKRGELAKPIEDVVFKMKKNDLTGVMDIKQGFMILQVLEHYDQGQQPVEKVEDEIMNQLYNQRMGPAMRAYLKTLREQSYVVIKPGYEDIAGGGNSEIQEVSATPEASKKKKQGHKKFLLFGKRSTT